MNRTCSFKMMNLGSLKAFVTVTIEDMLVRGFRIMQTNGGPPWVAMPSRENNKKGKKEYYQLVSFLDTQARNDFSEWILAAYRRKLGPSATEESCAAVSGDGRDQEG